MKRNIYAFIILLFLLFNINGSSWAQAPTISYTPSTNTFTAGTGIGTWSPTVGGGTIPASPAYASVTTLTTTGTSVNGPESTVLDGSGNIYMTNSGNKTITKTVISTGATTLIAGIAGTTGTANNANGSLATFSNPDGIAYDGSGNLYIADFGNNKIRKISTTTPFAVTTVFGSGTAAETDGNGALAAFNGPHGILYNSTLNCLFVLDMTGGKLRKIDLSTGNVTTLASIPGCFYFAYDGTNFYVTTYTTGNNIIKVGPSPTYTVSTFAGSGTAVETDGTGTGASFNSPAGIVYDKLTSSLFVGDNSGNKVRNVTVSGAVVTTIAGSGVSNDADGIGTAAQFKGPYSLNSNGTGSLYITDYTNNTIRPVNIIGFSVSPTLPAGLNFNTASGIITGTPTLASGLTTYTVTATNSSGSSNTTISIQVYSATPSSIHYTPSIATTQVGTAINPNPWTPINTGCTTPPTSPGYDYISTLSTNTVSLSAPSAITLDGAGNLYVAEDAANKILMVNISSGLVTVIAGTGTSGDADNTTGTLATLANPSGICYAGGYLYVTERTGDVIRKISTTSPYAVSTFAGTAATAGEVDASGLSARFTSPWSITYDGANTLYVAENGGQIKSITLSGALVTTLASTGTTVRGIACDRMGGLYVTTSLGIIQKVLSASPYTVSTFAGVASANADANGTGTGATFSLNLTGIVYDAASASLYVAEGPGRTVRRVTIPGAVVTGMGGVFNTTGTTNGIGSAAKLNAPWGITDDNSGTLYIADNGNSNIRPLSLLGYRITPGLPAGLSFNSATGAITGAPTAISSLTTYTVTATCTSGSSNTTINIGVGKNYDWTSIILLGGTNAWNTASNWSPTGVPGPADNARIGVGLTIFTNQPTISTNVTVGSITFGHGAVLVLPPVLTIAASSSLTVNNSFTVTGSVFGLFTSTVTGGGSGSTAGKLNMAPGSILNIPGSATLTLTSPLSFTLQSNANADAVVGQISAGAIGGTAASSINVQRYLSGTRGYRLLSSPVYAGSFTSGSNTFKRYSINYLKDSTFIQGTNPLGGFNRTKNPTIYIYRESVVPQFTTFTNSGFRGINDITASPSYTLDLDGGGYSIPVANGYLFYFLGGFTTATPWVPGSAATPATLTASGSLNIGQIIFTYWYTPGSTGLSYTASSAPTAKPGTNLVGNPYPSAINWDTFQTTTSTSGIYGVNIDNTIWILNTVTQNYGSYIANNGGVGSASFVSNIISSGQGFFVHASTTGAQLTFNESAKPTVNSSIPVSETVLDIQKGNVAQNGLMNRPVNATEGSLAGTPSVAGNITPPQQYLRLAVGQNNVNIDETLLRFNNKAPLAYDHSVDALYKPGYGSAGLATLSNDQTMLSINSIPLPGIKGDTVKLSTNVSTDGIYQLSLTSLVNMPELYEVWLMDAYKKDSLDIRHNITYNFNIYKNDTNSFGSKRFSLIIRQNPANAYRLVNFIAGPVISSSQILVSWQTINECGGMNFIVEHSTDGGKTYSSLGSVQGTNAGKYGLIDKSPVNGLNMYRLAQVDVNNAITYSKAVSVQMFNPNTKSKDIVAIYPNPGKDMVNLVINTLTPSSEYHIKFINSFGLIKEEFSSSQPTWAGSISELNSGIYIIQVSDGSNLIGETKFIKE